MIWLQLSRKLEQFGKYWIIKAVTKYRGLQAPSAAPFSSSLHYSPGRQVSTSFYTEDTGVQGTISCPSSVATKWTGGRAGI